MNRFSWVFHRLATVLSFLSVTLNIIQPALLALYFVTPAYAEEIVAPTPTPESTTSPEESSTPAPEATIEPSVEPSNDPTPSPSPDIILEPSPDPLPSLEPSTTPSSTPSQEVSSPEPTEASSPAPPEMDTDPTISIPSATLNNIDRGVVKQVSLSTSQVIVDSSDEEWNINADSGTAETSSVVKLGVKYVFPLESRVTLTFKSLPIDESLRSSLKITKVRISDLNLAGDIKPYGEYAYDITTSMVDGTFDYELTLPKPDNQPVDIVYMEDQNSTPSTISENQTIQVGDKVKADGLDHFTIFIVIVPTPSGPTCVLAGATSGSDCYATIQGAVDAAVAGDTIEIQSNITLTQRVNVNKGVAINGNGYIISSTFTKTDNSNNAAFGILSDGVTLSNMVIDGTSSTNLHGVNIYMSTGVLLDNINVVNHDNAGIVVNGSTVTVNNITTSGNGWGGINVDRAPGVSTEAKLIIQGTSSHSEAAHIWIDDNTESLVSVDDTSPKQYNKTEYGIVTVYTLKVSTSGNPSASLSQFANDAPTEWVNGNLGASKATYYEGDSVPYRLIFDNLSLASHTVTIEWDTTKSGKHAEDYLTTYNRSVASADPCVGVVPCSSPSTFAIPIDPQVSGAGVAQIAGNFTLFGGTITGVSAYSYVDGAGFVGDKSARITLTFTATQENPVLAWGGHIAHRQDWGAANSAISIPGSPYHMRLIDLDGSGGNQDRSLSADAVVFPASITIIKDADLNGSTPFSFTGSPSPITGFSLVDDGTASNTKIFSNITDFQTYSIAETVPSGWTLDSVECDVTSANGGSQSVNLPGVSINLKEGENVTCTFTNTLQSAHLTLVKTITNDNGGAASATDWTLSATGPTNISGVTGSAAVTGAEVNGGTYTLSETGPSGYTASAWSCVGGTQNGSQITLAAGESATCTINNNDIAPQLTVIKHVINDDGGTKVASDFTMNVSGTNVSDSSFVGAENPGTTVTLNAGGYSVDEDGLAGYAKTFGPDCTGSIAVGETKTCTITNDDIAPTLTLVKTVINNNGGNLQVSQVPLFISGSPVLSGVAYNVSANVLYTATETEQTGYLASAWGGDCASNGTITLQPGDNKTCTITNDDIAPVLTFIKVVNNNYGGTLGEFDFPLYINGNLVTSGVANTLSANTQYTLTESQQYGYTGGTITGDCVNGAITLQPGESKTCYITNNDVQPRLTVTKIVINDNGGNKQVSDFPLFVNTTGVTSGVQNGFNAGTYIVSETGISGYSATISGDCDPTTGSVTLAVGDVKSCIITNNDQPGTLIVNKVVVNDNGGNATADDFTYQIGNATAVPFEADGSNSQVVNSGYYTITEPSVSGYTTSYNNCSEVFVPNGGSATCTITNNDQQAYITVVKTVVNDNGGNADPDDFNLTLEGNGVSSGVAVPVNPGTYTAGETLLPGYTFTGFSGDCDRLGDVTIALGESKTCTLTNDDIAPTLTLIKSVVGGTASVDSFGLTIGATSVSSGQKLSVNANTDYALNEVGLSGYSFASLTGDTICPSVLGGTVSLNEGENLTCTITNTRDTGSIQITKIIDVDGNLATTGDQTPGVNWVMDVDPDGGDTSDPSLSPTNASGITGATGLKTGSYWVTEGVLAGYEVVSGSCTINGNSTGNGGVTSSFGGVSVVKNTTTYCTFINTPNSTLHGYKWHDLNNNGIEDELGTKLSGWTINLYKDNGEGYDFVTSMVTDNDEHFGWYWFEHLFPGTYKICEANQTGWLQTYPTTNAGCHLVTLPAGSSGEVLGEQVQNATYGVAYNFGNVQYSTVIVTKYSDDNGNGTWDQGEDSLHSWGINLELIEESTLESTTDENGEVVFNNLLPGDYLLSEDLVDGWQQTNISCSTDERQESRALISSDNDNTHTVSVTAGSEITCEIGNQAEPKLRIQKSNDATGNKNPGDIVTYTLVVDLTGSSLSLVKVVDVTPEGFVYVPGSYTATLNGNPLSIIEPNYASPGTWDLGDMTDGDQIVLTYQAKIASNQDGGTYNDIAWAEGDSKGWGTVLALGHDSEYVDDIFVGTDVVINKNNEQTGSVDIKTEGEVLGAATELPATGANTLWLILALTSIVSGLTLFFGGKSMKKITLALALVVALALATQTASAADPDNNLSVRIEQPQTPTRIQDWKLSYSVLDRLARTPSISCFVKKPGEGSYTQFDSTKVSSKATGDNGYCQVNSSVLSKGQGNYDFYVVSDAGADSEASSTISVNYDTEGPGRPSWYSKEHPSLCRWIIKFRTADDNGLTQKVEIYSSDLTNFNTDNGTRVGTVVIGSNQEGSYTHDRADNCDKSYYYVIRAFDNAGNQSAHLGDEVVVVGSTSVSTTSSTSPTLLVAQNNGVVLGQINDSEEDTQAETSSTAGEVMGENAEIVDTNTGILEELKNSNNKWWYLGLGLFVLIIIAYVIIKRQKNS